MQNDVCYNVFVQSYFYVKKIGSILMELML